jgi:EAL and modified HD-GYP domain-containing signal transduction protein
MSNSIVARQPILNRKKETVAYELLFRTFNKEKEFDGSQATAEVITSSLDLIGLDNLTGGKHAFINFTAELIKSEIADLLPQKKIGIEILEDIKIDQELISSSQKVKDSGHILLLDDFIYQEELIPLIEMADIIKIDFLQTTGQRRKEIMEEIKSNHNPDVKFLAEKIENYEEFQTAYQMGYDYFQGYFFTKPDTISTRKIPSYKFNYLQVINELNMPEPDFREISKIIKNDISMSYSLLRTINAAIYGYKVSSIKQAAALLGLNKLKKWAMLYFIKGLSDDKPDALFNNTLVRAKMAELIALNLNLQSKSSEYYTARILSMLDAYLDRPLKNIIKELSLTDEVKKAILNQEGKMGEILKLISYFEKADWKQVEKIELKYDLDSEVIFELYREAIAAAAQTIENINH